MTRICMIGNSHVAAMRLGWDLAAADHPGLDVEIFGAHARNLVTGAVDGNGVLRCDGPPFWYFRHGSEPARAPAIRTQNFDAIVIVGCDFGPMTVFRTYKRYYFAGLKGRRQQLLSRDQFAKAVWRMAEETAAFHLATIVHECITAPVFLVSAPLPAENGFADGEKRPMEPYQAARTAGDDEALIQQFDIVCKEVRAKGFTVIRQAEETQASTISTQQIYSENSVRLRADEDLAHPENDYFHMNDVYGRIMWGRIVAAVNAGMN